LRICKTTSVPREKAIRLIKCPVKLRMKKSPIYSPVVFAEVIACWNGFYMALENM
jgi:hypothetical protein